jgi:hypothetical protein
LALSGEHFHYRIAVPISIHGVIAGPTNTLTKNGHLEGLPMIHRRCDLMPRLAALALALLLAACSGGTEHSSSNPGPGPAAPAPPKPVPSPADNTAPSTPTSLAANAVSTGQINLTWSASNDNVGVTAYRIERCEGASCTSFTQIATVSATSYNNTTGLLASTTYRYRVRAADEAGNLSAYSAIVSATTLAVGAGGNLATLAAALAPGQWTTLSQSGDGTGFDYTLLITCTTPGDLNSDCADNIFNYADKGLWNPNTREIHFFGHGHYREAKHIRYREATHQWTHEPDAAWNCGVTCGLGHGFEHSAIDWDTGDLYVRWFNSTTVWKRTQATMTWAQLPAAPNPQVALALEYFPERNALILAGGGAIYEYRPNTNSWHELSTGLAMGPYSNVATYDPVHKVVVFGGGDGSRNLYKLNASGTISAIADAPVNVGIQSSVFTVDPVSGKYLLFGSGGGFYEYDVDQNTWGTLSGASVPFWASNAYNNQILYRVAVPISTHGVIAFMGYDPERVWLYKHAGH